MPVFSRCHHAKMPGVYNRQTVMFFTITEHVRSKYSRSASSFAFISSNIGCNAISTLLATASAASFLAVILPGNFENKLLNSLADNSKIANAAIR